MSLDLTIKPIKPQTNHNLFEKGIEGERRREKSNWWVVSAKTVIASRRRGNPVKEGGMLRCGTAT